MRHDPCDLDEAIARVVRGDREAYRDVIEACESSVRVVVAAIVPEQHQVEDVVQDCFVTAYNKLGEYQPGTNALAWMKTIARYLAMNERRRWCREQRRLGSQRRAELVESTTEEVAGMAERAPDDAVKALRGCIGRLSKAAREVVEAFYWSRSSAQAIAASVGKTTNWVFVVLHRSRAALADCIERGAVHAD
jgi:RNA polymerase sigma-70 factor (ECF subfamily)